MDLYIYYLYNEKIQFDSNLDTIRSELKVRMHSRVARLSIKLMKSAYFSYCHTPDDSRDFLDVFPLLKIGYLSVFSIHNL